MISSVDIDLGVERYIKGDRPWPERDVDWHISMEDGSLYPLKYVYALATEQAPASFSTNQAKAAMRHLGYGFVSEKAELERQTTFDDAVRRSLLDKKGRAKRLLEAPKFPEKYVVARTDFRRSADVVAEVLERADGKCEICGNGAPFLKGTDHTPYLEVHHVNQLAKGGEDTVENAVAACPNCHRKAHHGQ